MNVLRDVSTAAAAAAAAVNLIVARVTHSYIPFFMTALHGDDEKRGGRREGTIMPSFQREM